MRRPRRAPVRPVAKWGRRRRSPGLGPEPYVQEGGRVFITGPYGGAPFGLEIVTPAKAGPFDLGYITVRSKLYVDRTRRVGDGRLRPAPDPDPGDPVAAETGARGSRPSELRVQPDQLRPDGDHGHDLRGSGRYQNVTQRFQVGNCGALQFHPSFTAGVTGQEQQSGRRGPDGVGWARRSGRRTSAKPKCILPATLPARLTTLQKACTEAAFNANPASCPEGSVGGHRDCAHPGPQEPTVRARVSGLARQRGLPGPVSSSCRAKGSSWSWTARPRSTEGITSSKLRKRARRARHEL